MKPQFIRIRDRILNLANVQMIELDGTDLLNVYLMPNKELVQFANEEAHTLLVDRFSHYVTILRRTSVYFQENGLAVLA